MRFLLTGSAGFVGSHVAELGASKGYDLVLADGRENPAGGYGVRRVKLDIRDREAVLEAAEGCDTIIHCAAVVGTASADGDKALAIDVNVRGTAVLLEVARLRKMRLIHLSTASIYGRRPELEPLTERVAVAPMGVYAVSKYMTEILIDEYRAADGVDAVSIRPGFVYGKGASVGNYMLPNALSGRPTREASGADHPCDFTYVVDLARALIDAAAASKLPEPIYNVSGGVIRTRKELAAIVRELVPGAAIELGPGINPAMNLRGPSVIELAARDFGFKPEYSLESGMRDWFRRATS